MTDSTDSTTLELRRMVHDDPVAPGGPDLSAVIGSGRRTVARRRAALAGGALGAVAAIAVPAVLLAGGGEATRAPDDLPVLQRPSAPAPTTIDGKDCGVLSCVDPAASVETGTVIGDPLVVGALPGGGQELVYLINTEGTDLGTGEAAMVDVLKVGYRIDGRLFSTLWGPQPGYDGGSPIRFWSNPGLFAARDGSGDHYVVVGYVEGSPDQISWSTPDGRTGLVNGTQVVEDYTLFYLTRPLPAGYEPPGKVIRGKDGSTTVDELGGGSAFPPELTIHTSDGWSCSLQECGSMG